jgi:hypothetical protein
MPLDTQSSVSMGVVPNSNITRRVAEVELHTESEHSEASQVCYNDHPGTSARSTHRGSISHAGTARGSLSPRKAIPSQWMSPSSGPNLVTAQRAKERGYKKGSLNSPPKEVKTLGMTRSLMDIKKAHAADGASFLTKTAHTAVESDLILSTLAKSALKPQRTPSKPAWNSPGGSPLRERPPQQQDFSLTTSPHKTMLLSTETATRGHRHGASSVATSAADSVYHSAESSPVRSTVDLTLSFKSAAEVLLDEDNISVLQLSADNDHEQTRRAGKGTKPTLKIDTSLMHPTTADRSPTSHDSASSSSTTSIKFKSPSSAPSISRIPRVAGATAVSSARGPTRSSTLKRVQSAKLLTPLGGTERYISPIDSSGKTLKIPVLPRHLTQERVPLPHSTSEDQGTDLLLAQCMQDVVEHVTPSLSTANLDARYESDAESASMREVSRESNTSTVTPASAATDPARLDTAIIYSRRLGDLGTTLAQALHTSPIIVMMAHDFEIGTLRNAPEQLSTSRTTSFAARAGVQDPSIVQTRADQSAPFLRRRAESEYGLRSGFASDLRATAPEFVPTPLSSTRKDAIVAPTLPEIEPVVDLLGPAKFELDMYGIPWFYYMWQMQIAYEEGFQKGRSRSPKKNRHKKHHPPVSSPAGAQVFQTGDQQEQQRISDTPPHSSTAPIAEQQELCGRAEEGAEAFKISDKGKPPTHQRSLSPFAAQIEVIDRHYPSRNFRIIDRLPPGIDLTTIRNVGLPSGAYHMAYQPDFANPMPSRGRSNSNRRLHHRSDNGLYTYRGRGMTGVPMHNTAPFPNPVPPQGRPVNSALGSEACGRVDIIYASERIGGEACQDCEPDHPRE